jgi:hypothetical protein
MVALVTTALLSQYTVAEFSTGIPNILSLYNNASINSVAIIRATNLEPKDDDSTVF